MTHRTHRTARLRTSTAALLAAGLLGSLAACGGEETGTDPAEASDAASSSESASTASPSASGSESGSPDGSASSAAPSGSTAPDNPNATSENIVLAEPTEGAVLSGSFTASGKANSPEANVLWEIRDASGKPVKKGFATAEGWMDKLYPWTAEVDLAGVAPGDYTFVAMTDTTAGAEEGGVAPEEVSAHITVQ